jgi:Flp pilus assembly protein TadG
MRISRSTNGCKGERKSGVAATEFALICPMVILFSLACMDFGRISFYAETVSNAARAGAEVGATRQFTSETTSLWKSKVLDAVKQEMQHLPNYQSGDLVTTLTTANDTDGVVRVTVDLTYPFHTAVAWPGLPAEVRLHERVQYRQFR